MRPIFEPSVTCPPGLGYFGDRVAMDNETNLLHLLSQHQITLFLAGSFLLLGIMLGVGIIIGKFSERRKDKKIVSDRNEEHN